MDHTTIAELLRYRQYNVFTRQLLPVEKMVPCCKYFLLVYLTSKTGMITTF